MTAVPAGSPSSEAPDPLRPPAPDESDPDSADSASYEQARDELAAVVARLEGGGLTLDESLLLWERGELLARVCARFLEGARERVERALHPAAGAADDASTEASGGD